MTIEKKYNICIFGSGETVDGLILNFKNNESFNVSLHIPDPVINKKKFDKEIKKFKKLNDIDLCIVSDYRKKIDFFNNNSIWLNIHAGLLPYYRGFSSNSWAILNNEKEVGFTVHELTKEFDEGPIYFQKKYQINKTELYQDIRPKIINDIISETPNVCLNILEGSLKSKEQNHDLANYCGKIKPEDGYINNFDVTTNDLFNLYRIFAKPLGTGMYLIKDEKKIEIEKLILPKNNSNYKGITGVVVNKESNIHWVKTFDNMIGIKFKNFDKKIGSRLG
jgi:methionyl-tRNA formyltransferase